MGSLRIVLVEEVGPKLAGEIAQRLAEQVVSAAAARLSIERKLPPARHGRSVGVGTAVDDPRVSDRDSEFRS